MTAAAEEAGIAAEELETGTTGRGGILRDRHQANRGSSMIPTIRPSRTCRIYRDGSGRNASPSPPTGRTASSSLRASLREAREGLTVVDGVDLDSVPEEEVLERKYRRIGSVLYMIHQARRPTGLNPKARLFLSTQARHEAKDITQMQYTRTGRAAGPMQCQKMKEMTRLRKAPPGVNRVRKLRGIGPILCEAKSVLRTGTSQDLSSSYDPPAYRS